MTDVRNDQPTPAAGASSEHAAPAVHPVIGPAQTGSRREFFAAAAQAGLHLAAAFGVWEALSSQSDTALATPVAALPGDAATGVLARLVQTPVAPAVVQGTVVTYTYPGRLLRARRPDETIGPVSTVGLVTTCVYSRTGHLERVVGASGERL